MAMKDAERSELPGPIDSRLDSTVHWPHSPTPGFEFVRDIVIPPGFALLACASIIGGHSLVSTR